MADPLKAFLGFDPDAPAPEPAKAMPTDGDLPEGLFSGAAGSAHVGRARLVGNLRAIAEHEGFEAAELAVRTALLDLARELRADHGPGGPWIF